jgi:transposase-like protein
MLDMGHPMYVCTTCSEHFTRKYSAKRHNITLHHNNGGDIVTLVEYLVRRSSGRYQASIPSWHRRSEKSIHKFGRPTVADYVGDAPGLQREQQGQYQYH